MSRITDHILLPLLRALLNGTLDPVSRDKLIRETIARSQGIITWMIKNGKMYIDRSGLTLYDITCDITAELVARDEEGHCGMLRTWLLRHREKEDMDLLATYQSLLFLNIQRQLPRVFAEISPIHHSLLISIREHVRNRDDVSIRDMLDGRWYLFGNALEVALEKPAIPLRELERNLYRINGNPRSVPVEIFRLAAEYLVAQDEYCKAVAEKDIVKLILKYIGQHLETMRQDVTTEPSIEHDVAILSMVIRRALSNVRSELASFYIERNKLTTWEFDLMLDAVEDFFLLQSFRDEPMSGFALLRRHMPGLTHERYRQTYRRKFSHIRDLVARKAQYLMKSEAHHQKKVNR
ncbi:MAG: hypothetical protein KFH87_07435 [Bacteroidetes bacterium]|nr:hypothetical protein [Bacteroidota bacterium]